MYRTTIKVDEGFDEIAIELAVAYTKRYNGFPPIKNELIYKALEIYLDDYDYSKEPDTTLLLSVNNFKENSLIQLTMKDSLKEKLIFYKNHFKKYDCTIKNNAIIKNALFYYLNKLKK